MARHKARREKAGRFRTNKTGSTSKSLRVRPTNRPRLRSIVLYRTKTREPNRAPIELDFALRIRDLDRERGLVLGLVELRIDSWASACWE